MSQLKKSNSLPSLYDSIQEKKNLITEGTIKVLKDRIIELQDKINSLSKENADLRTRNAINEHSEKELSNAQKRIQMLEERNLNVIEKYYQTQKNLENKIEDLNNYKENEEKKNKTTLQIINQRTEIMNQIELENKVNKEEIKLLRTINEKLINDNNEEKQKNKVRNEIKFSKLKKRMTDNLIEVKKNVTKLNLEYMNENNRLTLLQNNQLINELELQAEKIEELEKYNKILKDKITYLENEIEIHKNVEINLVNKIKKSSYNENTTYNNNNSSDKNNITLFKKQNYFLNYNNFNFSKSLSPNTNLNKLKKRNYDLDRDRKKIYTLEKQIKIKSNENESLKSQIFDYQNQLLKYDEKYKNLFNYFEKCIEQFYDDEEIKNNRNFNLRLDSIKKCDFTIFSKEEQFSLLIIIMKYLMPIINTNVNSISSIGNNISETNLYLINNNYNKIKNFLKEPILQNAFNKDKTIKKYLNSNSFNSIITKPIYINREKTFQNLKLFNVKCKESSF